MKQKLTDRQAEIAIAVREVAKTPDNESWGAFVDFTRAIAAMIEGAESLAHPLDMQKRNRVVWEAYSKMWLQAHDQIVKDCLGSQREFDRVKSHPEGKDAIARILSRVKEVHGELTPGMEVNVNVGDIIAELDA